MNFYHDYENKKITKEEFIDILKILENYLIRRFVCNLPTNQLNKIFPKIYREIQTQNTNNILEGFQMVLEDKGYPKDNEFFLKFCEFEFYGEGKKTEKTKLILETIESSFNHKEPVDSERLTIEHIMPQTLNDWWKEHLGEKWQEVYDLYLNKIGNLTLTAYNSELSNKDFFKKKDLLKESHIELNKYFSNLNRWTKEEIEKRTEELAKISLNIWNYFGHKNKNNTDLRQVKGTKPVYLKIFNQKIDVKSWSDVLEETFNQIIELEPEKFKDIVRLFPSYVGNDRTRFRRTRELKNGYFIEVNLSAEIIQRICYKAIQEIGFTSEEWEVTLK